MTTEQILDALDERGLIASGERIRGAKDSFSWACRIEDGPVFEAATFDEALATAWADYTGVPR